MRVIVNIHSGKAAAVAGWRARAVRVNDKGDATLEEALMAATLGNGGKLYDYVLKDGVISPDFILIANGITITETSLGTAVRDNVQIHIMDNPQQGIYHEEDDTGGD